MAETGQNTPFLPLFIAEETNAAIFDVLGIWQTPFAMLEGASAEAKTIFGAAKTISAVANITTGVAEMISGVAKGASGMADGVLATAKIAIGEAFIIFSMAEGTSDAA